MVRVKQSVCPGDNFKLYDLLPRYLARSYLKVVFIVKVQALSYRMFIFRLFGNVFRSFVEFLLQKWSAQPRVSVLFESNALISG